MSTKMSKKVAAPVAAPGAPVAPVAAPKKVAAVAAVAAAPDAVEVPPPPSPTEVIKYRAFIAWLRDHAEEADVQHFNEGLKRFKKGRKAAALVAPAGPEPPKSDYMFNGASFDPTVCCARKLFGKDTRYKPAVYSAGQCGKKVSEGGLCKAHLTQRRNYDAKFQNKWHGCVGEMTEDGFVPEDVLPCSQTFGGLWAQTVKPVWKGGEKPVRKERKSKKAAADAADDADAATTDDDDSESHVTGHVEYDADVVADEYAETEAEAEAEAEDEEDLPPPPPKAKKEKKKRSE